jgi:general secretion pathway protein F
MPVSDAVATLARQPDDTPERDVLRQTNRALQAGHPLAAALPPAAFPPELRATIAAGEASGRLALLLSRLADMLEAQLALRGRLVAALAYPVLLVVVALGVIAAMLVFVVPAIAEQLLAAWFLLRRPDVRARADRGLLGLWGVGGWLSALEAVRWARMLATMLGSGLPLAEALVLTGPTLANTAWREASARIAADVRSGRSLAATLGLLPRPPALLVALARTGEASGRLAPLLESAAQSLDRQLSDRSRTLIALAEPLIIVTLGGIVGLIILAVLLPILQLNTLAAGGPGGP